MLPVSSTSHTSSIIIRKPAPAHVSATQDILVIEGKGKNKLVVSVMDEEDDEELGFFGLLNSGPSHVSPFTATNRSFKIGGSSNSGHQEDEVIVIHD